LGGVVTDASGAVIVGVSIILTAQDQSTIHFKTDENGRFLLRGIPGGRYGIQAEMTGFRQYKLEDVPLIKGRALEIEIEMQVGSVTEAITVEAAPAQIQTNSSVAVSQAAAPPGTALATPRLREYFPETLLWRPDLVTDANGKASLSFRMADSITTWKARVLASTVDGRWAEVSADLRAFQPFFLDLETPQVLTEGDRVELPYAVRDYSQNVANPEIRFEKNEWGEVGTATGGSVSVQALKSSRKAVLQATVVAGAASDAVRKTLEVRPDGERRYESKNALFLGQTEFALSAPKEVLSGGRKTELRVYTHLDGLLNDAIRGLVRIPTGCGEQTTSSAYLNLAAYRFFETSGGVGTDFRKQMLENLQRGVDGLEQYRSEDGGVAYWRAQPADHALSAYALQYLPEGNT
jgi:uncharacterized protein YfaS (alpha-2-macroglobulin family)